jgi:hypothetical protein
MIKNGCGFMPAAYIELARYYGHKMRNYEAALACVNKLESRLVVNHELGNDSSDDFILSDLQSRKNRITRKMSKRAYATN